MWSTKFNNKNNRNLLIKIVFGLILLGFFYSNYNYLKIKSKNKYNENKLLELQNRFLGGLESSEPINPDIFRYNRIILSHKYVNYIKVLPSLILVFDDKGCLPCIKYEIEMINKLYKKFPDRIIVFYSGQTKKYLESFSPQFSYLSLDQDDYLFDKKLKFGKPFVLLIGKDFEIYDIHRVEAGVFLKSNIFYSRIDQLFELINE